MSLTTSYTFTFQFCLSHIRVCNWVLDIRTCRFLSFGYLKVLKISFRSVACQKVKVTRSAEARLCEIGCST